MHPTIENILFVQDSSPCIRNIKMASALNERGLEIHLVHRDKTPNQAYGFGDDAYKTVVCLPKENHRDIDIIYSVIKRYRIDLVHYHNQPDRLSAELIESNLRIPVIYDQHDFLSFKHHLSRKEKRFEKICNEQSDGAIYVTESYKNEVARYYSLIENSICFLNYYLKADSLANEDTLPKQSRRDGIVHLVYVGRISDHKKDHRYIIESLKRLGNENCIVHVYPSKNKKYHKYNKLKHVVMHRSLPYRQLIREISQYDFGLTIFNEGVVRKLPHIRYGLGNKTFDYLCAGLPVLTQGCLDEVKKIVVQNEFGFIIEEGNGFQRLSKDRYEALVKNIREKRERFTMESQIDRLIQFYSTTWARFNHDGAPT